MDPAHRRSRSPPLVLAARRAMDPAPADSLSEEVVPDSIVVVPDSITPELQQPSPDSEMVPDSTPESQQPSPDSEMVPDSQQPSPDSIESKSNVAVVIVF